MHSNKIDHQGIDETQEEKELKHFNINADVDMLLASVDRKLLKSLLEQAGKTNNL